MSGRNRQQQPNKDPPRQSSLSSRRSSANNDVEIVEENERFLSSLRSSTFLLVLAISMVTFSPGPALSREMGSPDRAAVTLSALGAGSVAVEIFLSPLFGSILDAKGRKSAMMTVQVSVAVAHAVAAFRPTVWSICTAKAVALLCSAQLRVITQTIISDLTSSESDRTGAFMGAQAAMTSLGFLVGAIISGELAGQSLLISYGISAFLAAMGALIIYIRLPETLDDTEKSPLNFRTAVLRILGAPFAGAKLLTSQGNMIRLLSFLLLLQSAPTYMGSVSQIYSSKEWDLPPIQLSNLIALVGTLGIVANTASRYLIPSMGLKWFTTVATLSSVCFPFGMLFSYNGAVAGACMGWLSAAQNLGVMAEMTAQASKLGIPQGQLAGERVSLLALLKVVGPIFYSALHMKGNQASIPNLPFLFNASLAIVALMLCQLYFAYT